MQILNLNYKWIVRVVCSRNQYTVEYDAIVDVIFHYDAGATDDDNRRRNDDNRSDWLAYLVVCQPVFNE